MKTISIINLKGGVGKSVTAINIAHILVSVHEQRVLIIDNDKQGNTSNFFQNPLIGHHGIEDIISKANVDINDYISMTDYNDLDIITADMRLINAIQTAIAEKNGKKHTRLKRALEQVKNDYDYCIIDNAPDINISVINALVATDDVIVPVNLDGGPSRNGMKVIKQQIEYVKVLNPNINFAGCLITNYSRKETGIAALDATKNDSTNPVYRTHIRHTDKMKYSISSRAPITLYSPRCAAAVDYKKFVNEIHKPITYKPFQ